jgi:hypothetical protein
MLGDYRRNRGIYDSLFVPLKPTRKISGGRQPGTEKDKAVSETNEDHFEQYPDATHRPGQLSLVGGDNVQSLDRENLADLARIFDLMPSVGHLVVQTEAGGIQVSRDFPSAYLEEVDQRLAKIFHDNPAVTGITFPATSTRSEHTATLDDPHWSIWGKALAEIGAARARGDLTAEEATIRITQLSKE